MGKTAFNFWFAVGIILSGVILFRADGWYKFEPDTPAPEMKSAVQFKEMCRASLVEDGGQPKALQECVSKRMAEQDRAQEQWRTSREVINTDYVIAIVFSIIFTLLGCLALGLVVAWIVRKFQKDKGR